MPEIQSNHDVQDFEKLWQSLTPDPSKAKILIEVNHGTGLKTVLNILENMGINSVEHHILSKEFPEWILFHIPIEDIKEIVLSLSEAGFGRVKGINPGKIKAP